MNHSFLKIDWINVGGFILTFNQKILRVGELNPGLPRDRRGYSPLY
jgi:hypothetical protein